MSILFFLYFCILKVYLAVKSVKLMFLNEFNTVMSKTIYFNVFLNVFYNLHMSIM